MKIGISFDNAKMTDFFMSLALSLLNLGHEVYLFELPKHLRIYLKLWAKFMKIDFVFEHVVIGSFKTLKLSLAPEHKSKDNTEHICFDRILVWNGEQFSNINFNKLLYKEGRVFYFENGYFPNTLQMNQGGANAKADYVNKYLKEFLEFKYPEEQVDKENIVVFNTYPAAFKLLYILSVLFSLDFARLVTVTYRTLLFSRFKFFSENRLDLEKIKPFVFFPLQVNTDTQIQINSPYKSMHEILGKIIPHFKNSDFKLVIKEHPQEVEFVNYSRFCDGKNIFCVKKFNIDKLIDETEVVVTVNSSVGLQAVEKYKPVVLLGDSFYKNAPNVIECDLKEKDILSCVRKAKALEFAKEEVDKYINHFKQNIFIPGNWRKPSRELVEKTLSRLLA